MFLPIQNRNDSLETYLVIVNVNLHLMPLAEKKRKESHARLTMTEHQRNGQATKNPVIEAQRQVAWTGERESGGGSSACCQVVVAQAAPVHGVDVVHPVRCSHFRDGLCSRARVPQQHPLVVPYAGQLR